MNTVIITCGTSLVTNTNPKDRDFIGKISNKVESDLSKEEKEKIKFLLQEAEKSLNPCTDLKKVSAESNTILSYYKIFDSIKDNIYLLNTDTYIGEETAKLLQSFIAEKTKTSVNQITIKNLKMDSYKNFSEGLKYLHSDELLSIYKTGNANTKVIFILSGGFKAMTGYMQAIGMLYADEVVYQFETSENFVRIPKLPVQLNLSQTQKQTLRLLSFEQKPTELQLKELSDTIYLKIGNEYALDNLGLLLWEKVKDEDFYAELQPSLYDKLIYSDNFKKDYEKLQLSERKKLGDSLDRVAMYLKTSNPKYNVSHINFHSLINCEYSHEFYIPNSGSRVYINKKKDTYEVIEIDDHLK